METSFGLNDDINRSISYASTSWTVPLAGFGNPDYIAPTGREGIFGQTLRNIGQDATDGLVSCMQPADDGGLFWIRKRVK